MNTPFNPGQSQIDFVMVGYQVDEYVYLMGSRTMTQMELEEVTEYPDIYGPYRAFRTNPGKTEIFLRGKLRNYTIIRANSYPEAFSTIINGWAEEDARSQQEIEQRKAIEQTKKEIGPSQ